MRLRGFAESSLFQNFVLGIVCLNAFVLGLLSLPYFLTIHSLNKLMKFVSIFSFLRCV